MKNIIIAIMGLAIVTLYSCKVLVPFNDQPLKIQQFVLDHAGHVQFYSSREIHMTKDTPSVDLDVDSKGVIIKKDSRDVNEVLIPEKTPGTCGESPDTGAYNGGYARKLIWKVNFDKKNGKDVPYLQETKDRKITLTLKQESDKKVLYGDSRYNLGNGTGASLLVSKKEISSLTRKYEVAHGSRVGR